MLDDESRSYEADPNKKMHVLDYQRIQETNNDGMQHIYQIP